MLAVVPLLLALSACERESADDATTARVDEDTAEFLPNDEESAFLARHWPAELAPMGAPPAGYSRLEASLSAEDCGLCHPDQYADWQGSRHSRSMGPGLLGQLLAIDVEDPSTGRICRSCHAPLAEQLGDVTTTELARQGLVCAGCHVRAHRRYGPPAREGGNGAVRGQGSHQGFVASTAFLKSAFCRRCHQFSDDGFALNGKLIEDTYREWRQSRYARAGVHCQDCHMPQRRHLWRGIHDPDMVRRAIAVRVGRDAAASADVFKARIEVENRGAGHDFPTYATARVIVRASLVDERGETIAGSLRESIIGRELSLDLSEERFDTRIAPDETLILEYQQAMPADTARLQVELIVDPDAFYRRFFSARVAAMGDGDRSRLLHQALLESQRSSFSVYRRVFALDALPSARRQESRSPDHAAVDWNDAQIVWHDYRDGLLQAQATGRPMLLFFYAEWCPACHAYRRLFYDPEVVAASRDLIMARIDVDQAGDAIEARFRQAGDYVPRIFVLSPDGRLRQDLPAGEGDLRHFIAAGQRLPFLRLMRDAVGEAR